MYLECVEQLTEEVLCYGKTDPPCSFARNLFGSLRSSRYVSGISKTATHVEKLPIFCVKSIHYVPVYEN